MISKEIIDGIKKQIWQPLTNNLTYKNLLDSIEDYNNLEKEEPSKENIHIQMIDLDQIEHYAYKWFDKKRSTNSDKNKIMFTLLDQVQREHKNVVKNAISGKIDIWMGECPQSKIQHANTLWRSVLNKANNKFIISNEIHTEGGFQKLSKKAQQSFEDEVYSVIARIMSRPNGRKLIEILDGEQNYNKKITFHITQKYRILGEKRYADFPYVGAMATASIESKAGVQLIDKKVVPGEGSGAAVMITPGLKDSSILDFDSKAYPILSPVFIGIGHELIHAAHYIKGSYIRTGVGDSLIKLPKEYSSDLEEFLTIAQKQEISKLQMKDVMAKLYFNNTGSTSAHQFKLSTLIGFNKDIPTEGELRSEHDLSIRHGHINVIANPLFHQGAKKGDPGQYVKDGVKWFRENM